jgi:hypothetical protein
MPIRRLKVTSLAMVKSLLDGLNHEEQIRGSDCKPSMTELTVTGVHVHHDLAIIEQGRNTAQGAPSEWRGRAIDDQGVPDR